MTKLRLALVQLGAVPADPEANLTTGLQACATAAELGADIVVFPEMWQIGYAACPDGGEDRQQWIDLATTADGPWVGAFAEAARRHDVAVLVTYLEKWPPGPRNSATLIDRHGNAVLTYAKVHTCDFGWESALTPGDRFVVESLETAAGPVRVGVMICYDREFPESARTLMLGGAELILTPNACELTDDRVGQFRARAYENMTAVAMTNYPAPEFDGRSCAFSGMAFTREGASRHHQLVEAGASEQIVMVELDLAELRAYRDHETWGDSYRKPFAYEAISSLEQPQAPFIRSDSRRRGSTTSV